MCCMLSVNFIKSLMSGDTGRSWSFHGCMWRGVNRETWVDLSSLSEGSSVMNVLSSDKGVG